MTLQVQQLACMRGERLLFRDLDFTLSPGEAMRVVGHNGSGKTSLLRMLCGLACPADGEVRWEGENVRSLREQFGAKLIYLGHANGVKDDLVAWENVVVASALSGHPVSQDAACDALEALGLGQAAWLPTRSLSQGQRKRVALARLQADAAQPLWILDEPFTALDQSAVDALCRALERHLARGGILVYTTHQEIDLGGARLHRLDLGKGAAC